METHEHNLMSVWKVHHWKKWKLVNFLIRGLQFVLVSCTREKFLTINQALVQPDLRYLITIIKSIDLYTIYKKLHAQTFYTTLYVYLSV